MEDERVFSIKASKAQALRSLKGRWKAPVLVSLIFIVILGCVETLWLLYTNFVMPHMISHRIPFFAVIIPVFVYLLIVLIILSPMCMSYIRFIVRLHKSAIPLQVKDILSCLRPWKNDFTVCLLSVIKLVSWVMLYALALVFTMTGLELIWKFTKLSHETLYTVVFVFLFSVGYISLCYLAIRRLVSYGFAVFISVDNPKLSALDCIKESIRLTKGNINSIIVAFLSLIGWYILSILTLGIGLLWYLPYTTSVMYNVYRKISEVRSKY